MTLSSLDRRLLEHLTAEARTATMIWRRFYGLPEGKLSLTSKMRRERREVGARLEDLAHDGYITRVEIERRGVPLPGYYRGDAYDASFPSRKTLEQRARR